MTAAPAFDPTALAAAGTPLAPTLTPKTTPSARKGDDLAWGRIARDTVVPPGSSVSLQDGTFAASFFDEDLDKDEGQDAIKAAKAELFGWQDRFYAQSDRALLIVLQGIDAAGKDSTIQNVMSGCNPAGVTVHSFKAPSARESSHDYLWRHNLALPELGQIAIFNRSHYENVLVTRVHPEYLWPKTAAPTAADVWAQRYRQINDWERTLTENGTTIVKLFLNVSAQEQRKRFLARIDDPAKNWKFSAADVAERAFWPQYIQAFTDMLEQTSTPWAPWHVIPSDKKWFSHVASFAVLLETMRQLAPAYPTVSEKMQQGLVDGKKALLAEK